MSNSAPGRPAGVRCAGCFLWGMLAAGLPAVAFAADTDAGPVLGGPEILKLDWNTRGAVVRDFNGDGRNDIAVINNDRARLELLLQRAPGADAAARSRRVATNRWEPVLEDARFDKQPLSTGATAYCLAAGDLNSDGRIDLVYSGDPDALTVRLQTPDGDWDEKQVFDPGRPSQYLRTLEITDYDGDGREDLVVLTQKDLVIFRQSARGELAPPERYALSDDNCFSLQLADLNADGRRDVLYLAPARRDGLRVRRQLADGRFGPEVPYRMEISRTALELLPGRDGAAPAFALVQNQTAMLSAFVLVPRARPTGSLDALKPRVFTPRTGAKNSPSHALGDIDGDGRMDLAVADADGAQLLVYFQSAPGDFAEARTFPSLAEARALAAADWDGDGKAELFLTSAREQTLAVARFTAEGRVGYPQPLAVSGKPIAVDAGVFAAGEPARLAVAVEEGGKRRIEILGLEDGAVARHRSVELAGLRTDPRAVMLFDADQDQRLDIGVFVPFEPLRILRQKDDGAFEDLSTRPTFRRGLVDKLEPAQVTLADVDGDDRPEMLVATSGMARVLRVDRSGDLFVADQFNAREPNADITAVFASDVDGDEQKEIVLFDRRGEQLQVLRRNAGKVFEFADTVPVGRIDLVATRQADLDGDAREDLLFLGKDRFWMIPTAAPDFTVDTVLSYETDLERVRYSDLATGDLTGDGVNDFVLADTQRNLIEILVREGSDVRSTLHFRIFESDPHVQNRGRETSEPREILVADVTGDGRNDLLLLVHDRLLIYPRE